jgi:phenylalanyl-tRNA synthetase beta chain
MKLALNLLEKFIDLPSTDAVEVRKLLDDLGLEVKDVGHDRRGVVYTIETLANRGDHLSAIGVAREIAARTLSSVKTPACIAELPQKKASLPVRRLTDKCMRYALLEAEIASDMKLRSDVASYVADAEALHPLVSILNFVQAELGQPMHAFDRDKLEGEIVIELSDKQEEIEALDGKKYLVPAQSILIKDKKKIIAVAGVIGCANSMVTDSTKRIAIEAALFCPVTIRKTARKMALVTDAAYAFERGVDTEGWLAGLKRVGHLLGSPASASGQGSNHLLGLSVADEVVIARPTILLPLTLVRTQLGMPRLDEVQVSTRLKHLGYLIEVVSSQKAKEVIQVTVPTWRVWDVDSVEDLIEDIARSIGYNQIKLEVPALDYAAIEESEQQRILGRLEPILVGSGFLEVISRVFYSAKEVQLIEEYAVDKLPKHIALKNSIESAYSHLKVTNIIHAAQLAETNQRRGVLSVKAFELGQLFGLNRGLTEDYQHETTVLSLWQSGRWMQGEWRQPEKREDKVALFTGVIEQIFRAFRSEVTISPSSYPLLHPGCQGELRVGRKVCGFFGQLHPALQAKLDLKQELLYAELSCAALATLNDDAIYQKQSEYPAIRRDLTVRLSAKQFASEVEKSIRLFEGFRGDESHILTDIETLNDFKKEGEDFRRVSFRLTFQSSERTLEGQLVDGLMEGLFQYLESRGNGLV